ncbi:MAG: methyltransferase domain-containing protein [Burkholderiales bacterium]|nr:methyltransferase domain-containing protein [Burkholderiales bacterium]
MTPNFSVDFFDTQFRRQVAGGDYVLNPFEKVALQFLRGRVLDYGCGLGNLAVEAARRGHEVVAVDASAAAIARIRDVARAERLKLDGIEAEIGTWAIPGSFDTIAAIGLFMFFPRETALSLLRGMQEHVAPGGIAIVNVLVEGTTFMGMFEAGHYCLFGREELRERFAGWRVLHHAFDGFDAPEGTRKEFATIVAEMIA